MSAPHQEVVTRIFEAYNRGDYDAAAELAHLEVEMFPPGNQPPYRGRDALRRWMEPEAFVDQGADLLELETAGNKVLAEAHSWMTGAASGIELEVSFWSVWSFDEGGLVTRCEVFLDREPALRAFGPLE
jgi:ketosteroid isomerase-like protein